MSKDIGIPTGYTLTHGGAIDADLDNIHIKEIGPITVTSDIGLNDIRVKDLAPVEIGLDKIRIKELPTINLKSDGKLDIGLDNIHVTVGIKPVRIHLPSTHKASICVLGRELVSFKLCGESMVVVEDYTKKKTEDCK